MKTQRSENLQIHLKKQTNKKTSKNQKQQKSKLMFVSLGHLSG